MYSIRTKVYPSACDNNGKMKLYRVMQTMQDCSELWMQSEPLFEQYFNDNGMTQLLAYRQIDIIRQPSYGEDIQVTTSIFEVNSLFGHRNTCICDAQGQLCYISWSMGAFVNRQTGRLQKVPEDIFKSVSIDPPVQMEYTERRIILPHSQFQSCNPVKVSLHDIDYNHHVNNAEYLRIALELLPSDFTPQRIRIEYKTAAKLGDTLIPEMIIDDKEIFVTLKSGNQNSVIFQFSAL